MCYHRLVVILGGQGVVVVVNNLLVDEVIGRGYLAPFPGNSFDLVVLAGPDRVVAEFVSGRDKRFVGRP